MSDVAQPVRGPDDVLVFISYAHDDANIAKAVRDELVQVNPDRVNVFLDAYSIQPGQRWDTEILANLRAADWLIFIYTGRERRSYDYCGLEIGVFTASKGLEFARDILGSIHLTCFHDTPDVPAMFKMLQTTRVDGFVGDPDKQRTAMRNFYIDSPLAQFFVNFYRFPKANPLRPGLFPPRPDGSHRLAEQPNIANEVVERCARIAHEFREARRKDPTFEKFYQVRMELHVPEGISPQADELPPSSRVVATQDTFNLIGISPDPDVNRELAVTWQQLRLAIAKNKENQAWMDKVEDDVLDAIHQRNLRSPEVTFRASDGQLYRPLLARQVGYESGARTFSAIFVRTLPRQFVGDENTSALLIGLILASRFRFTFVEALPSLLGETLSDHASEADFQLACRQLLYDVERMEQESSEFGMNSPNLLQEVFGPGKRAVVDDFYSVWLTARQSLFDVIKRRLAEPLDVSRVAVRDVVQRFAKQVEPLNSRFLEMCIDRYGQHVRKWVDAGERRARRDPAARPEPVLTPAPRRRKRHADPI